MNIKVFNMDFGESILLENSDEILLVDCGSKQSKSVIHDKIKIIRDELQSDCKKISFMITHFHIDHYKGYLEAYKDEELNFPRPFNIYMPWISFKEEERKDKEGKRYKINLIALVHEAIYLYVLYKEVDDRKNFLFWLRGQIEFILDERNKDCRIVLLKKDDIFPLGTEKMKVLWPQAVPVQKDDEKGEAKVSGIFQKIEDKVKIEHKEEFQKCKKILTDNIIRFYEMLDSNRIERQDGVIEALSITDQRADFLDILERQNQALDVLDDIKKHLDLDDKERENYRDRLKKIFRERNNSCSIVFRNYKELFDNQIPQKYDILMMGDITKNIIDKYLYEECFKNTTYGYLKSPHHGTCTHYTTNIPQADNLIISNGNGCKTYRKISSYYFGNGNEFVRKYCTNNRCEIVDSNRSCNEFNPNSSCYTENFYSITIESKSRDKT